MNIGPRSRTLIDFRPDLMYIIFGSSPGTEDQMTKKKIKINRAPVLTLWAAVVAERLGYDRDEALTFGKGVAGLNAQSKGRHLGIYEEKKDKDGRAGKQEKLEFVEVLGRGIPAVKTSKGLRATIKGDQIEPESVERYLRQKFGDDLEDVRAAMQELAGSLPRGKLAQTAFTLYEKFRPDVPEGTKGWGAKGELDLDAIRSLAK
jgi:hypothetical protein